MNPKRFAILFILASFVLFGLWLPAGAAPKAQQYLTPTPGADGRIIYVVQPGDTLFRIALRFRIPMSQLAQANGITNFNRVFVGQVLVIP